MWAVVQPLLVKFAVEEVVNILIKAGVLSQVQGAVIKTAEDLKYHLQNIQVIYAYPGDPSGQSNASNFTVGQKSEP